MVILVVEDDALLNFVTCEDLIQLGYEVVSASNADRAIEILEARDDIRVLFTDIDMPGSLDGLKLATAVRHRWPPIRVIVTSGNPLGDVLPPRVSFIAKPYRVAALGEMISAS